MKFGFRTPNLKKSFKSRTTGQINRTVKKALNPTYGKKGVGIVKNPKKAFYNKIYNKSTFDTTKAIKNTLENRTNKMNKLDIKADLKHDIIGTEEKNIKANNKKNSNIEFSPKSERILNIFSYVIAFIILSYIIILIVSFIIGLLQGIFK